MEDLEFVRLPLYSYAESDYLASVTRGTSKRWIDGYEYWDARGNRVVRPPVTLQANDHAGISFLDLIEIRAIGNLKVAGFSLRKIRDIVLACQQIFKVEHPLVTFQFKVSGRDIFVPEHRDNEVLVDVGRQRGQYVWHDVLAPFLEDVEYEHDLARRWYPLGTDKLVVVDPDYGYGLPVVRETGVRTEILFERFQVGESIQEIAEGFNLQAEEVEQALQFESRLAKKPAA